MYWSTNKKEFKVRLKAENDIECYSNDDPSFKTLTTDKYKFRGKSYLHVKGLYGYSKECKFKPKGKYIYVIYHNKWIDTLNENNLKERIIPKGSFYYIDEDGRLVTEKLK